MIRRVVQISGSIAVILNIFLIFVLVKFSNKTIGFYKWMLVTYSVYEVMYAAIVILSVPTHTLVDDIWVVFTYAGLLPQSSYWGPGLYCFFYLLWLSHLLVMFIYRYIVVTKENWANRIKHSRTLIAFLGGLYVLQFVYCFICGVGFCSQHVLTENMKEELYARFEIWNPGFIQLDYQTFYGILGFTDHHVLLVGAFIIIPFTSVKMWNRIVAVQKERSTVEVRLNRQIMVTLLVQTAVPLVLYIGPSLFLFSYPIWPKGIFGVIPHLLSIFTTFPKIVDPILVIVCVQEYRRATLNMFRILPCCRRAPVVHLNTTAIIGPSTIVVDHQLTKTRKGFWCFSESSILKRTTVNGTATS